MYLRVQVPIWLYCVMALLHAEPSSSLGNYWVENVMVEDELILSQICFKNIIKLTLIRPITIISSFYIN